MKPSKILLYSAAILFFLPITPYPIYPATVREVIDLYNQKNYQSAIEAANAIINDPKAKKEEKAQAQLYLAHCISAVKGQKQALEE